MPPPTQSEIWNYFNPIENDRDKSQCKICSKTYSRKGRTTSSLKNHLKSMHPEEFTLFEKAIIEKELQKIKTDAVQTAKQEWKKLRDNHRDALKRAKLGKNKLLPAQITTWKYAKSMQFLEPHMKYRVTEHIEPDASHLTSENMEDDDQQAQEGSCDFDVSTSFKAKKRKYDGAETSTTENKTPKYDGLQAFFNFMSESVRAMPMPMQTQVKKKIFNIVVQAEEELTSTSMIGVDVLINEPDNSSVNLTSYDNDDTDEDYSSNTKVKAELPEDTD